MAHERYLNATAVRELVRRKAQRMIGRAGFTTSDQPDIEQEFWLKLVRAVDRYDPSKGEFPAFAQTVVNRYAKSLLTKRIAAKRRAHHTVSLNVNVRLDSGETVEWSEQMTVSDAKRHREIEVEAEITASDRRIDIHAAVKKLSAHERQMAEALQHDSITEAARRAGIPRTTSYWRLHKICKQFDDADLRDYLR